MSATLTAPDLILLETDEAAGLIKANARSMERWRTTGYGPRFVKVGRKVCYRLQDLEAWIAQQTRSHTNEAA